MKNLKICTLLAALLLMGGWKMQAQEYVPMIQEGNEWCTLEAIVCKDTEGHYNTLVNWLSGDTLINEVRFTKVMETLNGEGSPYQVALLREGRLHHKGPDRCGARPGRTRWRVRRTG